MDCKTAKAFLRTHLVGTAERMRRSETAKRYYLTQNDILFARPKGESDALRSADNRIPHSFYPLLVNQKAAYLFADPPVFTTGSENADRAVRRALGASFAKQCKSLCVRAANGGLAWIHYWQDRDGAFRYGVLDGADAVPVYSDDLAQELVAVIRLYQKKVGEKTRRIYEIWDSETCSAFSHDENEDIESGLREERLFGNGAGRDFRYRHPFGRPPFILFANNEEMRTDLESIKSLIDMYDLTYSGFANDLEDIQEVILTLSGYSGTDLTEFLTDLKKYKVIKLDDWNENSGVDTLSIEIPVQAREKMLEITRKAIFEEGQGVDPQQTDFGNASGVALQFMYSLLELKAGLTETEFRCGFEQLVRAIGRLYGIRLGDIGQIWTRTAVRNDRELSEIAAESTGILSRQTVIARHPWVENPAEEMARLTEEG